MITAWLTPLLAWLGLELVPFLLLVIALVLIFKGD